MMVLQERVTLLSTAIIPLSFPSCNMSSNGITLHQIIHFAFCTAYIYLPFYTTSTFFYSLHGADTNNNSRKLSPEKRSLDRYFEKGI